MSYLALDTLVAQIRSLPGQPVDLSLPRAAVRPHAAVAAEPLTLAELRVQTAALLARLAERVDATVPNALRLAETAWDQADAFVVFDDELRQQTLALAATADLLAADEDDVTRAAGVEARLAIDSAVGLVALVERRFAALVRLRLRSATPELMIDGKPFLDVAAALAEASRRWR